MNKNKKSVLKRAVAGFITGIVNGLFGAGGGMLAVPAMDRLGMDRKAAHANSVALIFPISLLSAVLYITSGSVQIYDAIPYIPFGIIGAGTGTLLLAKMPTKWLKKFFALFMIWAGVRLMIK